jgi:hypothetical protein
MKQIRTIEISKTNIDLFFVELGFELGASHLQTRCPTASATTEVHCVLVIFGDGIS